MEIKLDIILQRLCILRISQALWQSDCTVKEVKKILFSSEDQWTIKAKWMSLIKKVIKKVPATLLPTAFHQQLKYAVRETGIRIIEWYLYLRDKNLFKRFTNATYETYLKTIYWTYYGIIDEEKTFRLFLLPNSSIDIYKRFKMAAHYCLKDILDDLWEKLPEKIQNMNYAHLYEKYDEHIIAYWFHYYTKSEEELITDIMDSDGDMKGIYDESHELVELNLALAAIQEGMHLALKYFYSIEDFIDYLDVNQHLDPLFQCRPVDKVGWKPQLVRDRNLQIFIFLYKQHLDYGEEWKDGRMERMEGSDYSRLSSAYFFLTNLFTSSPWQEFLLPIFKNLRDIKFAHNNWNFWTELFPRLSNQMIEESEYGLAVEKGVIQKTFNQLWSELKPDFKLGVAGIVMADLFKMWNIRTIKLILNDKDLVDKRETVLGYGNKKILKLFRDNPVEIIDEYVTQFLIDEEWNILDQESIREIYRCIFYYEFSDVNAIFEFNYRFKKEQRRIKNLINSEVVCCFLLYYDNYKSANKFLKWKYDSADEIKNFKKTFKDKRFTTDLIFNNWTINSHDCDTAELDCNKFLKWCLGSDKEILDFKKVVLLQRLQPVRKLDDIVEGNYKVIDCLFNWCCFTPKEKDKLKKEYVKEYLDHYCESYIESARVKKVGGLLYWAFPIEKDRNKYVTDFIASKNGLKALKRFIILISVHGLKINASYELFQYFIEDWLKPLDESSRKKIKKILTSWNTGWSESYQKSHNKTFNVFMDVLNINLIL